MSTSPSTTTPFATFDLDGGTTFSALHSDIIDTHILTRLDGPALAAASCTSTQLRALTADEKLWKDISISTWPSINDPRVQDVISTLPSGHRSFVSDSFPVNTSRPNKQRNRQRPSLAPEIVSAVDIYYNNQVIWSKVEETDTTSSWFRTVPFRVDLLDPDSMVSTTIPHTGRTDTRHSHLEENLTLSWIIIDPTRKRTANISSLKPVSVQQHWLAGYVQVRYATILAIDREEFVQCEIVVTCGGKEGGEMYVTEVTMQMEDMNGSILNGEESLVILQGALESGRRKGKRGEERERRERKKKRERRERKKKREMKLDTLCITVGVTIFFAFWSFVLLR